MAKIRQHRCKLSRGVTLLETMIVLAIIGGMLTLLLPAIQRAREAARDGVCKNHIYQIWTATNHFWSARKQFPEPAKPDRVGGWAIAILPFLEEQNLAGQLANNPELQSVAMIVKDRPRVLICPVASEGDSSVAGVPAAHYSLTFDRKSKTVQVNDVPLKSRVPWVYSPEMLIPRRGEGPHSGGYYLKKHDGDAKYFDGQDTWQ